MKKKTPRPRPHNKKLKKEYYKGIMAGYQKYLSDFLDYKEKIRSIFGGNISQQLVDMVEAGEHVDVTIEVSGKDLILILRKEEEV